MKRFQLDGQWQRDLYALSTRLGPLFDEQQEHVAAGYQCRDHQAPDEAAAELALAYEIDDEIALHVRDFLEHALKDFR